MEFPHLERLSGAECRQLLPAAPIGRLAVGTPHFPSIEPVSFALVEGEIVIAVRAGSAGEALAAGARVTFEADRLDYDLRRGWSVAVTGPIEDLDADVVPLVTPLLSPWRPAAGDRLLLIRSEQIRGHRVVAGAVAATADPQATSGPSSGGPPAVVPTVRRSLLNAGESFTLLERGEERVGRLVITVAGEPLVFPLNYAVQDDAIVFRTQVGTKLTGITRSMATFQVDHIDASGQGWSVTFEGLAQEVLDADPAELRARLDNLALDTWPGGDRQHVVRITPYAVRGTRWTAAELVVGAAGDRRSNAL
ncbi:MAG TPA: pyridoxamine 5'-phosphate oxidase family protein [Acidimicrobiia bacterium]|nr:pyridoxamine 5'-phosphate oxidase family protein [Acidimicrobiia bacterium]